MPDQGTAKHVAIGASMSAVTLSNLDEHLSAHLTGQPDEGFIQCRKNLEETGFAMIPQVLPASIKKLLADEDTLLAETRSVRRDVQLKETSDSHRKMRNVTAVEIRTHGRWIAAVDQSPMLREALSWVAGEPVELCPYLPEQYVVTRLESSGDTHGWHWDDYSFGLIFVVECPPLEFGGFVQTVADTSWDKADPKVFHQLVESPIRSHALKPGDVYLLRTDTTMHQVHPILSGRRTIVNMAFAADRDMEKEISHETMEELFQVELPGRLPHRRHQKGVMTWA